MKNPNKYGTISKLSGNRRKPYQVREGISGKQRVIACCATKEEALQTLAKYNASPWDIDVQNITVQGVYDAWMEGNALRLSEASRSNYRSVYRRFIKPVANMPYRAVKAYHMRRTIDAYDGSASQKNLIRSVWCHLDKQALEMDVISKAYSSLIVSEAVPRSDKTIYSKDEIQTLWDHREDPHVDMVLIFLYTGLRITEAYEMRRENVHLDERYMIGGVKTKAGKNRIIPIHPYIFPLVEKLYNSSDGEYLFPRVEGHSSFSYFRKDFNEGASVLETRHTPHECRHTFRTALDETQASRVSINKIMGHSAGDVGEDVYTHKTIEMLHEAILYLDYKISL